MFLPISLLSEVVEFFQGRRKLENALKGGTQFETVIPKASDFGIIRGQDHTKEAGWIAAAGGHNLLML